MSNSQRKVDILFENFDHLNDYEPLFRSPGGAVISTLVGNKAVVSNSNYFRECFTHENKCVFDAVLLILRHYIFINQLNSGKYPFRKLTFTPYYTFRQPTRGQYRKVFIIAASVCVIGGTFCNVFISGKLQPWNDLHHKQSNTDSDMYREEEDLLIAPSSLDCPTANDDDNGEDCDVRT